MAFPVDFGRKGRLKGRSFPHQTPSQGLKKETHSSWAWAWCQARGPFSLAAQRSLGAQQLRWHEPQLPRAWLGRWAGGSVSVLSSLCLSLQKFSMGTYAGSRQVTNEAEQSTQGRAGQGLWLIFLRLEMFWAGWWADGQVGGGALCPREPYQVTHTASDTCRDLTTCLQEGILMYTLLRLREDLVFWVFLCTPSGCLFTVLYPFITQSHPDGPSSLHQPAFP